MLTVELHVGSSSVERRRKDLGHCTEACWSRVWNVTKRGEHCIMGRHYTGASGFSLQRAQYSVASTWPPYTQKMWYQWNVRRCFVLFFLNSFSSGYLSFCAVADLGKLSPDSGIRKALPHNPCSPTSLPWPFPMGTRLPCSLLPPSTCSKG